MIPGRLAIALLSAAAIAALIALILGVSVAATSLTASVALGALAAGTAWDYTRSLRAWRSSSPTLTRQLPAAFALGGKRPVEIAIETTGFEAWSCQLHDGADASVAVDGLPIDLELLPGKRTSTTYDVTPTRRGDITFTPADLRIRSRWGLCELLERVGPHDTRRVYPDFTPLARYAWLAGDRRLQEIGVKTYQLRGQGTDFKQLSEYHLGDAVRHIDWRASLRFDKPIVREFQDERDQTVMLLVDCGRRMRADDRQGAIGSTHFDQVLNAVILLSYVALKQGDAVGAMTFGTPPGEERSFAARKGATALPALMAELYGIQPTPTHSDYVAAAQALMRRCRKRALVIVITNFRDEDSTELAQALRLLQSRHLVLLGSMREQIVGSLIKQPLTSGDAAIEVASAHLYEQSRRDAFNRLATRHALLVDAEPDRLGVHLVNRYHAVKRAGLI
jgi:uncharacterized protein (DUF58 family)